MGFNSGGSGSYFGGTYEGAQEYMAKGKNKDYRAISRNAYLGRQGDGSISLTLHDTAIVTYHANGIYTLYHGGWRTVTTQAFINGNTPFRVGSSCNKKYPGWTLGNSGEFTPARMQKCRTCHGEGGTVTRRQCGGASRYSWNGKGVCRGATTHYAIPYSGDGGWSEHWNSRYTKPCEHGERFTQSHPTGFCKHGRREGHPYGEIEAHECYRCDGEGRRDYGSQPIPIIWDGGAVLMAADGTVLDTDVDRYYPTGKPAKGYKPTEATAWTQHFPGSPAESYVTSAQQEAKHTYGGDTNRVLESLLPAMREDTKCPSCRGDDTHRDTITQLVIHLNDSIHWTRETIADWLDTLDADLRFPTPIGA